MLRPSLLGTLCLVACGPRAQLESREVLVPAGEFIAGANCEPGRVEPGCDLALHPRKRVSLPAFYVDRDLVTREEYASCVRAGACVDDIQAPPIAGISDSDPDRRALEVFTNSLALVRQENAAAYCAQHGGRLPTGDEFERIARGTDGRSKARTCREHTVECWNSEGPAGARGLEGFDQWIALRNRVYPHGAAMGGPDPYAASRMALPGHDIDVYAAFRCVRDVDPSLSSTNAGHASP